MRVIYTVGIWLYTLGVRVAALFGHEKARQMVHGWHSPLSTLHSPLSTNTAWFHASSLGEFEQARPVLEEYKRRHTDCRIVVTFFSPSGYEVRKKYAQADVVLYLPPDLPGRVRRFLDAYRPTVAFFVKYDFWFNYLDELRRRNIPTYIFSAIFRPTQYFFKPWGRWYLRQLRRCFSHIFVQNEESMRLLKSHGVERCSLAGDTRFDRVHQIAQAAESDDKVERWLAADKNDCKVLVCGSTWPPDEELIKECLNVLMHECASADATDTQTFAQQASEAHNKQSNNQTLRIILAPHVISEEHLQQIERLFPGNVRYSKCLNADASQDSNTQAVKQSDNHQVLVIDNIGMLSKLYRYADVAYIGGGFGSGIHNILEAVTFGKPVLFGPNYRKFKEAHDIIARGGGFSHTDAASLRHNVEPLLTDPDAYRRASEACTNYMKENLGSTEKILGMIK